MHCTGCLELTAPTAWHSKHRGTTLTVWTAGSSCVVCNRPVTWPVGRPHPCQAVHTFAWYTPCRYACLRHPALPSQRRSACPTCGYGTTATMRGSRWWRQWRPPTESEYGSTAAWPTICALRHAAQAVGLCWLLQVGMRLATEKVPCMNTCGPTAPGPSCTSVNGARACRQGAAALPAVPAPTHVYGAHTHTPLSPMLNTAHQGL